MILLRDHRMRIAVGIESSHNEVAGGDEKGQKGKEGESQFRLNYMYGASLFVKSSSATAAM